MNRVPMATNFGRVRIYNEEEFPPHKAIRSFNHVVLKGHVNYFSCWITTTTRPIATKFGRVVIYNKTLQPVKSHNPLNT